MMSIISLDKFDRILNAALSNWKGITVIAGDMNINVLEQSPIVTQYKDILQSYNLIKNVNKPTRKGKSAIAHIIATN